MGGLQLDALICRSSMTGSRRVALHSLVGGRLAAVAASLPRPAAAGRKRRRCLRKGGTFMPKGARAGAQ